MKTFVPYFIEANIALILFYIIYRTLISNQSKFRLNRFILLSIPILALLVPLISVPVMRNAMGQNFQITLPTIDVNAIDSAGAQTSPVLWAILLYSLVAVFLALMAALQAIRLLRQPTLGTENGYVVATTTGNSFSFFNRIYLNNELTGSTRDLVFRHEKAHADEHHSVDILFYEILCALFWCNPAVWLLRREIRINHEYLVDAHVKLQYDQKTYLDALLGEAFQSRSSHFFSTFNHSQTLKKRIKMMLKTPPHRSSRYLLASVMAILVVVAAACADKNELVAPADENAQTTTDASGREVFSVVDRMPQYPGGQNALFEYLGGNITYPETAKENETEGVVYVSFVIEKNGAVTNINVLRGIGSGCDAEAIRVISTMPNWEPGVHKGKPVPVLFNLPIRFKLMDDGSENE